MDNQQNKKYKKEIITLIRNNVVLGYMARDYVLLGCSDYSDGSWYVTRKLHSPRWQGAYKGRKKARAVLESLANELD